MHRGSYVTIIARSFEGMGIVTGMPGDYVTSLPFPTTVQNGEIAVKKYGDKMSYLWGLRDVIPISPRRALVAQWKERRSTEPSA